jgi:hypothetical protein
MLDSDPSTFPNVATPYRDAKVASTAEKKVLSFADHETFRAILGYVNSLFM